MPLYTCEGIVLRAERLEDADRLVHFYTNQFGRVQVRIRGVARTHSRYGSIAELFSHDHLSLYKPREDRPTFSLTRGSLLHSNQSLRNDLQKYYAASFVVELIDHSTEDEDPHYDLWLLLMEMLHQLSRCHQLLALLLAFQLKALRYLGFGVEWKRCFDCEESPPQEPIAFSYMRSGIICRNCQGQRGAMKPLSTELYKVIQDAIDRSLSEIASIDIPVSLWKESVRILKPFWMHHLDFDPKSLKFIESE